MMSALHLYKKAGHLAIHLKVSQAALLHIRPSVSVSGLLHSLMLLLVEAVLYQARTMHQWQLIAAKDKVTRRKLTKSFTWLGRNTTCRLLRIGLLSNETRRASALDLSVNDYLCKATMGRFSIQIGDHLMVLHLSVPLCFGGHEKVGPCLGLLVI